ncbi:hypothetical protein TVAG_477140 [Trichomonas vaginalis G3]|uniref:Vps41 beta-propeller domain-containing protein n=1 Tax=Trichomonas vaginalis (strain ATCC PRA-98 / G3) TaxID=412133 RepID=A2DAD7_TRIV3|nr:regulation of SNARE complex assembly [Trichomonas vaginalis G3]EAY22785.1 hypothetical protein TVAG_477140 [Trichomonas vaginalis G3]KAI5525596.1 regulation of SNARE complex assembly [Trichomonas vaginalis G3]|eukprot:XP_001583771.1 hypothetical protein [Trichomonas vaginalis G3]
MQEQILKFSQLSLLIAAKGDKGDYITASTMFDENSFIFGTFHGRIVIAELNGTLKLELVHSGNQVNSLSLTNDKKYLLFADSQKTCYIYSIETQKQLLFVSHSVPIVHCVLDPLFNEKTAPRFFISDLSGAIYQYTPRFLFGSSFSKLVEPQQKIQNMIWFSNHLIYTTNVSLFAYDISSQKNTYSINPPFLKSKIEHHCSFVPLSPEKIGIVFGNYFYELSFDKTRSVFFNLTKDAVSLAYSKNSSLTVFTTKTDQQLILVDQNYTADSVSPPSAEPLILLSSAPNDSFLFVYPKSAFIASFSSWDERIKNILFQCTDDECISHLKGWLKLIEESERSNLILAVCHQLISKNSLKKASILCSEYLKTTDEWCSAIEIFHANGVLQHLTDYIPERVLAHTKRNVDILLHLLEANPYHFCTVFASLPPESFDAESLLLPVQMRARTDMIFNIPLIHIYHRLNKHNEAFLTALNAKYLSIFTDIEKIGDYHFPLEQFDRLYESFGGLFTDFLIQNHEKLPPAIVLPKFSQNRRKEMLEYMHKLFCLDVPLPDEFRTELAILYIEFHHPATMKFLSTGQFFNYSRAWSAANREKMWPEAAFLARKTGAVVEGMKIHLEKIRDPKRAVEYAIAAENDKVWQMLRDAAYSDVDFLTYMLDILPSLHIEAVDFVKHIPEPMSRKIDIASLSANTLKEFRCRLAAVQLTTNIIAGAAFDKFNSQLKSARRAKIVRN